jgi:hypothetical protein
MRRKMRIPMSQDAFAPTFCNLPDDMNAQLVIGVAPARQLNYTEQARPGNLLMSQRLSGTGWLAQS